MKHARFGLAACLAAAGWAAQARAGDGDREWWNQVSVQGQASEKLQWRAEVETYLGDDMTDLYHVHEDLSLTWAARPWLDLTAAYREVQESKDDEDTREHRPHVAATFKGDWADWDFASRNRMEYRLRDDDEDGWRYRNRMRATAPVVWDRLHMRPYLEDEIFYDFVDAEISQNRVTAGVSFRAARGLDIEVYYRMRDARSDGDWETAHIVGTSLGFKL